jgi:hypothetical protein
VGLAQSRTRGPRHGDFKNNFTTYEINLMGSFNAPVFREKPKMIENFLTQAGPSKRSKRKKSSNENIYVYLFMEIFIFFQFLAFVS